ncbi:uncharacterized protein LOC120326635 [Styela clava]
MEKERREDVFSEVAKKFPMREFKKFAKSEIGLVLDHNDVVSIIVSNNYESDEEQKVQILHHWAEKNGTRATNEKLKQLVIDYFKMGEKKETYEPAERLEDVFQAIVERFADIRQFKRFARSKSGLSLDHSKVRSIDESNNSSEDKCIEMLHTWKLKTDFFEKSNLSAKIEKLVDDYFFEKDEEFEPEGAEYSSPASTSQQMARNQQSQEYHDDTRRKSGTRHHDETCQDGPRDDDGDKREINQYPKDKGDSTHGSKQKTSSGGLFGIFRALDQKNEKRDILRRSMDEELKKTQDSFSLMEMFASLYEANDADLIKDHVKVINFENTSINPSGMLAIASVMRRSEKLDLVRFSRCNLDSELIGILGKNVNNTQLEISSFEFTQTEVEISRDGMKELSSLLQSFAAASVNIHCYCSDDALLAFADTYKRGTINNFTWKLSSMISAKVFVGISAFVESHVDKFVTNNRNSFDEYDIGILSRSKGSKKVCKKVIMRAS